MVNESGSPSASVSLISNPFSTETFNVVSSSVEFNSESKTGTSFTDTTVIPIVA